MSWIIRTRLLGEDVKTCAGSFFIFLFSSSISTCTISPFFLLLEGGSGREEGGEVWKRSSWVHGKFTFSFVFLSYEYESTSWRSFTQVQVWWALYCLDWEMRVEWVQWLTNPLQSLGSHCGHSLFYNWRVPIFYFTFLQTNCLGFMSMHRVMNGAYKV
jgi:hypothetical protein